MWLCWGISSTCQVTVLGYIHLFFLSLHYIALPCLELVTQPAELPTGLETRFRNPTKELGVFTACLPWMYALPCYHAFPPSFLLSLLSPFLPLPSLPPPPSVSVFRSLVRHSVRRCGKPPTRPLTQCPLQLSSTRRYSLHDTIYVHSLANDTLGWVVVLSSSPHTLL